MVLLSIGIEDEVVDLKGKVVYCNRGDEGKFESGILFVHLKPNDMEVLNRYIQAFEKQYG